MRFTRILGNRLPRGVLVTVPGANATTKSPVPLIGLEVHAQLISRTKLFSRAPYRFAAPPNTQLALLDAAIPGSMPILNKQCAEAAVLLALALNSQINTLSTFDRKHYFYADSPAGYQITQHLNPIAEGGHLDYIWQPANLHSPTAQEDAPLYTRLVCDPRNQAYFVSRARIKRLQLEQDTGKSLHDLDNNCSLIDLNRFGVGLIELVTEPDFANARQVGAFLHDLSTFLAFLGCCNANASKGELRVDVNVSVGPSLTEQGPRVEVKNVNSIRNVMRSIEHEIARQSEIVLAGDGKVLNETRTFSEKLGTTVAMRDKEVLQDYRYLPEPNLPPLRLLSTCQSCDSRAEPASGICIHCLARKLEELTHSRGDGELPNAQRHRLILQDGLSPEKVNTLFTYRPLMRLYDVTTKKHLKESDFKAKSELSFWVCGLLYSLFKCDPQMRLPSPEQLAEFVHLSNVGQLHGQSAQEVFRSICKEDISPLEVAIAMDCLMVSDHHVITIVCQEILQDNSELVALYRSKTEKKTLRRLLKKIFTDPKDRTAKFNPHVTERILRGLLTELKDENKN